MSAKILHKIKMGTERFWCLSGCDFVNNGVLFRVIGSESTGSGAYDVTHTIKNVKTGAYSYIPMPKLITILLDSE
jgi:hypothetical protein